MPPVRGAGRLPRCLSACQCGGRAQGCPGGHDVIHQEHPLAADRRPAHDQGERVAQVALALGI